MTTTTTSTISTQPVRTDLVTTFDPLRSVSTSRTTGTIVVRTAAITMRASRGGR